MIFSLYRYLIFPLALSALRVMKPFLSPKIQTLFEERKRPISASLPTRGCILIHAASGEIEYAKPVIRGIRKRWPHLKIVVSYYSPSAKKLHRDLDVDDIVPLPFDRPGLVQKFLDSYSPVAVLIARSDIWPEFVYQCHQRGIHSVLFSATASSVNVLEASIGRPMKTFALSQLSLITCVSEDDAEAFRDLTSTPVVVHGDTRYEQVLERLKNLKGLPLDKINVANKKIGVLGSTWPEDDAQLLPAVSAAKNVRWIWAPHEIHEEKLHDLQQKLTAAGLKVQRFSESQKWDQDVLLVDKIGVLAELYSWGDFAFVGGSFKKKVHSVMEPLAAGLPVIVGPHHKNNREAIEFQKIKLSNAPLFAVETIHNSAEILNYVEQKISFNTAFNTREILCSEVQRRAQATAKLLDVIGLQKVTTIS